LGRIVVLADPGQRSSDPVITNFHLPAEFKDQPSPSRHCFWKAIPLRAEDGDVCIPKPEIYSICAFPPSTEIYDQTQLLVLSWDSANGDPLYLSDSTLAYLETQGQVRIAKLLSEKAIILIETQAAQSRPVQEPYDAVLGANEVTLNSDWADNATVRGTTAAVNKRAKKHPILKVFSKSVTTDLNREHPPAKGIYENVPDKLIPKNHDKSVRGNIRYNPTTGRDDALWYGWFTSWGRDWIPLLNTDSNYVRSSPILLAKVKGEGLLLASTMWISASQCKLASRIAETAFSPRLMASVKEYHKRKLRLRNAADTGLFLISLVMLIGILFGLTTLAEDQKLSWVLAVGGVGIVTIGLMWWNMWTKVRARPFGVPWYRLVARLLRHPLSISRL
jgi:hypothetical protein